MVCRGGSLRREISPAGSLPWLGLKVLLSLLLLSDPWLVDVALLVTNHGVVKALWSAKS